MGLSATAQEAAGGAHGDFFASLHQASPSCINSLSDECALAEAHRSLAFGNSPIVCTIHADR